MFDGEIVKNNFPLQKMLDLFLVQDRVLYRVQDKVGLRKFSSNFFFCKKPQNVMFDGDIVKNKISL